MITMIFVRVTPRRAAKLTHLRAPKLTHPGRGSAAAKALMGKALSSPPAAGGWVTFGVHTWANSRARRSVTANQHRTRPLHRLFVTERFRLDLKDCGNPIFSTIAIGRRARLTARVCFAPVNW